jgi:outer membrane protein assembly factor BamD (BamD/ComL family)
LKNVPLTDEAMQQSNDSIANALYTAGRQYTDKFEDYESAIKTYEDLRQRFPAFQSTEEVLFQLFYSYTKTGNTAKAAELKKLLAEKYPGGHYTGIATTGKNPEANTTEQASTKAYEAVYDLFIEGKFGEAKAAKQVADSIYGTSSWSPQLLYIEAVYHIRQGEDSAAKDVLNALIEQSGDAPIAQKATTMLDVLNRRHEIEQELRDLQIERPAEEEAPEEKKVVQVPPAEEKVAVVEEKKEPEEQFIAPEAEITERTAAVGTDAAAVKKNTFERSAPVKRDTLAIKQTPLPNRPKVFTYTPEETHYAVVLLNKVDVVFGNEAKNAFARYNREKYYNRTMDLNVIPLNEEVKLLTIGAFANIQDVVDYVQKAKPLAGNEIVPWLKKEKYSFSIISEGNLQLLQENKDLPGYQAFLDKNLPVKL